MAKLLIIGGTGFFGKSILDAFKLGLLQQFQISKIIILARNTNQFRLEFPELVIAGVELVCGDITQISSLPLCDYVIHAAAVTNMDDYTSNVISSAKYNVEKAVSNFCKIVKKHNINSKILYCSSGIVYGKQPSFLERIPEDFEFQDNLEELSTSKKGYCLGKRFAEKEFIKLANLGHNVSIARCFSFKGKYLPKNLHYAYGNFINNA